MPLKKQYFYVFIIIFHLKISTLIAQNNNNLGKNNPKNDTLNKELPLDFFTVDRPGLADLPYAIQRGNYQFEIGFDYIFRGNNRIWQTPNFLLRTGLAKNLEIHFGTKHWLTSNISDNPDEPIRKNDIANFMTGFKYAFYRSKTGIFDAAIVGDVSVSSAYLNEVENLGRFYWSTQWALECNTKINKVFSFNYFVAHQRSQYKFENVWSYAFCLDITFNDKWAIFVENFDYISQENEPEIGFDGGILYNVTPYIQLDINGGVSRYITDYYNFVGVGVGFRLDTKKAKQRVRRLKF